MNQLDIRPDLLYFLPPDTHSPEQLIQLLNCHQEIRFVSFVGIDMAGNDTDEKIPMTYFIKNISAFLDTKRVHSDGSAVNLPGIAKLHDGTIDFLADKDAVWFVDYNYEHVDPESKRPIGTLRIPSFIYYKNEMVCSRSILKRSIARMLENLLEVYRQYPALCAASGFSFEEIDHLGTRAATELEFWVSSPDEKVSEQRLSIAESLKEHYWKRTRGKVRTALEKAMILLEYYGYNPEMAHKEVGGVKANLSGQGELQNIMEQLEITWQYADACTTCDYELFARIFIKECFRLHGLDVSFSAKPLSNTIGSGKHIHVGFIAYLKDGRAVNLFTPEDISHDYLSVVGWGALLGFLKHYHLVQPFISMTNDSFARLQPGYEAPTHISASIGKDINVATRNRTVLVCLVRLLDEPHRYRFEIRSPDPRTNSYLCLAAGYQCMWDGIKFAVNSELSSQELQAEFSKAYEDQGQYLPKNRQFRVENDLFMDYSPKERDRLFGRPPATVYECLRIMLYHDDLLPLLCAGDVFSDQTLASYARLMLERWEKDLSERILPHKLESIRNLVAFHAPDNSYDETMWSDIQLIRTRLAKDTQDYVSIFTEMRLAIDGRNLKELSKLQQVMNAAHTELITRYHDYCQNQIR